jgi:hypothetical protein
MPMDFFRNQEENELFEHLVVLYREFRTIFQDFTNFIHQNYPEVNFKETSVKARQWNAQFRVNEI